jgi:hypothetical protein
MSWLNGTSLAATFPALYKHSRRENKKVAEAMENDNWVRDLMHNITSELMTLLPHSMLQHFFRNTIQTQILIYV